MRVALRIPEPCHADWNAMHARAGGRHCDRCAHTVLDLTRATDAELIDLVRRDAMPKCARLSQGQLNRVLGAQEEQGPSLLAAAAAGAALLLSAPDAAAQQGRPSLPKGRLAAVPAEAIQDALVGEVERVNPPLVPAPVPLVAGRITLPPQQPEETTAPGAPGRANGAARITGGKVVVQPVSDPACARADAEDARGAVQAITSGPTEHHGDVPRTEQDARTFTGRVVERTGEPLPFATLVWANGEPAGSTDFDGHFSIRLTPANPSTGFVVHYVGYHPQAVALPAVAPSVPWGGASIIGDVVDAEGRPLPHCTVAIEPLQLACVTDDVGRFAFDLPAAGLPEQLIVHATGGGGRGGSARIGSGALPQCVRITVESGTTHAGVRAAAIALGDVIMEEGLFVLGEMAIEVRPRPTAGARVAQPFRWLGHRIARAFARAASAR